MNVCSLTAVSKLLLLLASGPDFVQFSHILNLKMNAFVFPQHFCASSAYVNLALTPLFLLI